MVKDILEALKALQSTPIPTILVVAGIVFLLLSITSQLTGGIAVPPQRQRQSAIIGCLLLVVGLALNIIPPLWTRPNPLRDTGVPPSRGTKLSSSGQEGVVSPPGQEIPTAYASVMARIARFGTTGALVTLEITVKNGGKGYNIICGGADKAQLFDQQTRDSWKPVETGGGISKCNGLSVNEESGMWMQFEIPNPDKRVFYLKSDLFNRPVENLVLEKPP